MSKGRSAMKRQDGCGGKTEENMVKEYGEKKGKEVYYASKNAGKVDAREWPQGKAETSHYDAMGVMHKGPRADSATGKKPPWVWAKEEKEKEEE